MKLEIIKRIQISTIILVSLGMAHAINAQIIPSSTDLSYLLDAKANIHLSHKVITKANNKWVLLEVTSRNNLILDSLTYSFAFVNDLNKPIKSFATIVLNSFELTKTTNKRVYGFEATSEKYKFLILRLFSKQEKKYFTYIINLNAQSSFFISKEEITIPIIENYTSISSKIKIAKLTLDTTSFSAQFFSSSFPSALPPMANLKLENPFKMADTTYLLSKQSKLPTGKIGVYSIFEKDNEKAVSFYRITSKNYPQLTNISDIIEASIFLFTKKEEEKITNANNPKFEYDSFWLKNTGSSERAGKMISAYFKRVKESNILFTTFKEGWKTDMGMIYIIFGVPSKVFRSDSSVEWVYEKTYELPTLIFNFNLINTSLDTEYFELERDIKYQNNWFRAIDLWRKGRKNL